jgi:hypothetical protein
MFNPFKSEADRHYTDGGSIYCPSRKADVDVDYCLGCFRLVDAREDGGIVEIRCTAPAPVAR